MMKRPVSEGLPFMTREEWSSCGLTAPDFVLVSGDAYVDHPSFGPAIIARVLMHAGYSVAVIAQPDWKDGNALRTFGRPALAFLVTGGNIDSMVNHYTVMKRRRREDAYTPGGIAGKRPDRAVIVYGNLCRQTYEDCPVILGGIESSLRRFAHYDYWDDKVRHSILYDACADLLVYGMGEKAILEIASLLEKGIPVKKIRSVRGTCWRSSEPPEPAEGGDVLLPSFEEVRNDKRKYAQAFMAEERENDPVRGKRLIQPHEKGFLVCNPPMMPLERQELDGIYALPFTRKPHPSYTQEIPALKEVSFSITSNRGCYGGCSFCALTFHQGRIVQSRSSASILSEAESLTRDPGFKGIIHDVGGPTANFRAPACPKQRKAGVCFSRQCIGFEKCANLKVDHGEFTELLKQLRSIPGIRKVFIRSGVRYDYLIYDKDRSFLEELVRHHISGQLKVAPEHVSDRVLYYMNKPGRDVFDRFLHTYEEINARLHKKQYLVPYLISSHPGSRLEDAVVLAEYIRKHHMHPEQVQDFYPTPGTLSTTMFYTGIDPRTGKEVYVPRTSKEKSMQRALMQYYLPSNRAIVREALLKAGREDLIGYGEQCLIPPDPAGGRRPGNGSKQKISVDKRRRGH